MLVKVLITIVAILIGLGMLKRRNGSQGERVATMPTVHPKVWIPALVVVTLIAAGWGWSRYQSHQTLLQVKVFSPAQNEPQLYLVRQGDMDGRRFVTVNGLKVTLGDQDRVEIQPVD
ncbi:hypothetical protein [Ferrimonas balearica]|uniref:hypothetical protein n=1 Tax=Ferrimonas balearica TaxID=44012 RepID=UPI001C59AC47|nr:hypothetical protein [Ferrimonas balearica]MBW3139488.1 hypothetical protein [Ferrimonas balearica]MBW3162918.1 hypothetical protein [Ferrimonas balearica]MBY6106556.1 hypothetical protein [Ferrimonas balearica]MBY6222867.1 hypothetical protein [Ferrimonas balearica]